MGGGVGDAVAAHETLVWLELARQVKSRVGRRGRFLAEVESGVFF